MLQRIGVDAPPKGHFFVLSSSLLKDKLKCLWRLFNSTEGKGLKVKLKSVEGGSTSREFLTVWLDSSGRLAWFIVYTIVTKFGRIDPKNLKIQGYGLVGV
jgi:hypothetical protein